MNLLLLPCGIFPFAVRLQNLGSMSSFIARHLFRPFPPSLSSSSPSLPLPHRIIANMSVPTEMSQPHTDCQESLKKVNVRIKGTVQGVYYRQWTVQTAQQLGLNGWVRNRRDGTVEAVFAGKPSVVDDMIEKCRKGPPAARVTDLEVKPLDENNVSNGFTKHPTQ